MSLHPSDPSAPGSVTLPEMFGPYQIVRPLGKGGMGSVFLALDTRLNREVALKVSHIAANPQVLERFRREARAAANLSHPNLCPVYEFDVRDGIAYLTMAYVDGPTLDVWLSRRGPVSQREAALLVAQLASAMQDVHDAGFVHRDLKPANVAVNKKGEPIILDFGLARQLEDSAARLTKLGSILGTPAYMAPEQAGGDPKHIGPACDVYSLGVMLYELLTGSVPFQGPTYAVLAQALHSPPESPRKRNPAVDERLETICLTALAKKPADRPANMAAFAQALTEVAPAVPHGVGPGGAAAPFWATEEPPTENAHGAAKTLPQPPPTALPPALPIPAPPPTPLEAVPVPTAVPVAHPVPLPVAAQVVPVVATPVETRAARKPRREPKPFFTAEVTAALVMVVLVSALGYGVYRWKAAQHAPEVVDPPPKTVRPVDPRPVRVPAKPVEERPQYEAIYPPESAPSAAAVYPPNPGPLLTVVGLPVPPPTWVENSLGMRLRRIKRGTFDMGSPETEHNRGADEKLHRVTLTRPFYIGATLVTQKQWEAVMGPVNKPSLFVGDGLPVDSVSWEDAREFCRKLTEMERSRAKVAGHYRLPYEAEWEYACRAGTRTPFWCGPTITPNDANFDGNYPYLETDRSGENRQRTTPVTTFRKNPFDLHDMHGNMSQWCEDFYDDYPDKAVTDPDGPETGLRHVIRGGSWGNTALFCRSAHRSGVPPTTRDPKVGFRVVFVPE